MQANWASDWSSDRLRHTLWHLIEFLFRARPLKKLCEFEGKPLPEDYKSDCYQDVDETEYACKEKYRIMVSDCWKIVEKRTGDDDN